MNLGGIEGRNRDASTMGLMMFYSLAGLSADFWRQCQTNQAGFPQGVDMVLTCGEWAIGLPRSTQVQPALER